MRFFPDHKTIKNVLNTDISTDILLVFIIPELSKKGGYITIGINVSTYVRTYVRPNILILWLCF